MEINEISEEVIKRVFSTHILVSVFEIEDDLKRVRSTLHDIPRRGGRASRVNSHFITVCLLTPEKDVFFQWAKSLQNYLHPHRSCVESVLRYAANYRR